MYSYYACLLRYTKASLREQVNQALARLPELDARILRFKYYEGCSAREIAARLDMKYERVRKRLQRALKKLMQQMEL